MSETPEEVANILGSIPNAPTHPKAREKDMAYMPSEMRTLRDYIILLESSLAQAQARCADAERVLKIITELETTEQGVYTNAGKVMQQMARNYFDAALKEPR